MAKKSTNTEETKQSTVVLNDEVNPTHDVVENTPAPINAGDCSNPDHVCTCRPGHCPNENCKSGHYWTEGDKTVKFLYHYDTEDETTPSKTKENPIYEAPKPSNPGGSTEDTDQIPSNDCGPEVAEPWAHDELLKDADGHTGLERELRLHCGVTYDVVKMWLDEIATATDKDAVIDKIAWHIPTGGPKSIKVHHKAKIVEALNALK